MSKLFISYSHIDNRVLEQLHKHMAILREEGKVSAWFDREILAGGNLNADIKEKLDEAEIFIAIVSPDYLYSNYCYQIEFKHALKRKENGDLIIVPVIAQPCDWHASPFGEMKAIPTDGKPISDWVNENTAYLNIVQELRRLLNAEKVLKKVDPNGGSSLIAEKTKKAYKVKQDFTEVDIIDFRENTFEIIRRYFEESLSEINTLEDIQARILHNDKKSFTCLITNRRKVDSKGYMTVQIPSESHFGRSGLNYSFSEKASQNVIQLENVFNIEKTDYELVWTQRSIFGSSDARVLDAKEIAEELWEKFIDQVGISY